MKYPKFDENAHFVYLALGSSVKSRGKLNLNIEDGQKVQKTSKSRFWAKNDQLEPIIDS